MKVTTTYERLMPTTADGHIIKVTTYYSSYDKNEIDKLQEDLRNTIGAGVVTEGEYECLKDAENEEDETENES